MRFITGIVTAVVAALVFVLRHIARSIVCWCADVAMLRIAVIATTVGARHHRALNFATVTAIVSVLVSKHDGAGGTAAAAGIMPTTTTTTAATAAVAAAAATAAAAPAFLSKSQ
jgi:hypothetical protein